MSFDYSYLIQKGYTALVSFGNQTQQEILNENHRVYKKHILMSKIWAGSLSD